MEEQEDTNGAYQLHSNFIHLIYIRIQQKYIYTQNLKFKNKKNKKLIIWGA